MLDCFFWRCRAQFGSTRWPRVFVKSRIRYFAKHGSKHDQVLPLSFPTVTSCSHVPYQLSTICKPGILGGCKTFFSILSLLTSQQNAPHLLPDAMADQDPLQPVREIAPGSAYLPAANCPFANLSLSTTRTRRTLVPAAIDKKHLAL